MRRRGARALRIGLFVLGIMLATWLPVSFWVSFQVRSGINLVVTVSAGAASFGVANTFPRLKLNDEVTVSAWRTTSGPDWSLPFRPRWGEMDPFFGYYFDLPLWLLAAVCLAWPVMSFILARRRRKGRGFEVGMTNEETRNPNE